MARTLLPLNAPALALLTAVLALPARAADCPSRPSWPTESWPEAPEALASRQAQFKALEDYAFTLTGKDEERLGIRTDAVVVVHKGRIIYERYARDWSADRRHLAWSMSKSFTSALTGLAVARGALSLEDSLCRHLRPAREEACAITVRHLLEFSSGLDWSETYEGKGNQASSVLAMLYGVGRRDMVSFITSHPLRDEPGTSWAYSSGDSTLLAGVLTAALQPRLGPGWAWELLFHPLGMSSATWERDNQGVHIGSSYLYATPRDLAKLGYLFLNDGCWEGRRLLPEGWVADSTRPSAAMSTRLVDWRPGDVQGRQWWLNHRVPGVQPQLPWPSVPEGAYAARGHWGQSMTVIPSRDLVVVRVADDRQEKVFSLDTFLKHVLALVEEAP